MKTCLDTTDLLWDWGGDSAVWKLNRLRRFLPMGLKEELSLNLWPCGGSLFRLSRALPRSWSDWPELTPAEFVVLAAIRLINCTVVFLFKKGEKDSRLKGKRKIFQVRTGCYSLPNWCKNGRTHWRRPSLRRSSVFVLQSELMPNLSGTFLYFCTTYFLWYSVITVYQPWT